VLGYHPAELRNRPLHELLPLRVHAAVSLVKRLMDTTTLGPMGFQLRCKDGGEKRFVLHRRYDAETRQMYFAGEEIS